MMAFPLWPVYKLYPTRYESNFIYSSLDEYYDPERSQIEYMIDTNIKFGIVGLYSLLEHSAKKICDESKDFWSKKTSITHFNSRDYFTPVLQYMDLVIEIQVAGISKSFEKINPYRQIRNQIIHNDSGINKELELFFKTSHAIIKDDKFHFTDTSCFASFYQEAVAFFNELFFRLEEKQEFKNIKQKFNIIAERILIDKVDFDQRFEVKFDKAEVGGKSTLVCEIRPKGEEDEDFIIKFMVKRGRKNQVINTPEPPTLITKGQNEKLYNFFSRFMDIANQGIEIQIFE